MGKIKIYTVKCRSVFNKSIIIEITVNAPNRYSAVIRAYKELDKLGLTPYFTYEDCI